MAAGIVEFLARQGATQLGVVAGVADTLRSGDSRSLAERIERQIAEAGVATRGELAEELGIREDSDELREGIERALGSGRAEWYGPGVYGLPRGQLEALGVEPDQAVAEVEGGGQAEPGTEAAENGRADDGAEPAQPAGGAPQLQAAVRALEGSLRSLGTALYSAGAGRSEGERIRELWRLLGEGVISPEEYEGKRSEILGGI